MGPSWVRGPADGPQTGLFASKRAPEGRHLHVLHFCPCGARSGPEGLADARTRVGGRGPRREHSSGGGEETGRARESRDLKCLWALG